MKLSTVLSLFIPLFVVSQPLGGDIGRRMEFINYTGKKVDIDWEDPRTGKNYPLSKETPANQSVSFESYVNHRFVVHLSDWESSNDTDSKQEVIVTVLADQVDQVVMLKEGLQVERIVHEDIIFRDEQYHPSNAPNANNLTAEASLEAARGILKDCEEAASKQLSRIGDFEKTSELLMSCMEQKASEVFMEMDQKLAFETATLKGVSAMAENYTCADPMKETSTPVEEKKWEYNGVTRKVGVLHNRPSSQIHIIHDFISPEECQAIKEAAAPKLHRGTVADGKGGSRMSENRKAWQAGVKYEKASEFDPIYAVKKRLFEYTNNVTGYNMELAGQEDIMSIQYFGSGIDDATPDRYTPHCDGECNGLPHKTGGRVATMVMYCDADELLGGATNFQNANVYVKPKVGAAAFFSYLNPTTRKSEEGFTSHSGCPVLLGTKRIAVQWMRIGVSESDPWDSFDTNSISKRLSNAEHN